MQLSDYASIAAVGGIALYDILAPPGQTISEACDRYLASHHWLTELVILAIYLHCSNHIPDQFDPIHLLVEAAKSAPSCRNR